ncbi:MAG: hypothetical protein D6729_04615, partial [Deltaproteobacteria bacterium]
MAGPRQSGELRISDAVRALLYELRVLEGIDEVPELDLERVREVEAALATRFGEDLLAAFAAQSDHLRDAAGMEWGLGVAHTGAMRQLGAPGDLVAFGRDVDAPRFLAVHKAEEAPESTTVVIFDAVEQALAEEPFERWLEDQVEAVRARSEDLPEVDVAAASTFVPRLVRRRLPEGSSGRRVRHPRFGE